MRGTVKEFKDMLEEMKTVYPYKDEDTVLSTHDVMTRSHTALELATTDEQTGVYIVMAKKVKEGGFDE